MATHRRRASPGRSQFTFAASPDRRDGADGVDYHAWAERIRGGNGYFGKSADLKHGAWTRGPSPFGSRERGEEDLRRLGQEARDGSSTWPPPLRENAGSLRTEARGRYVGTETDHTERAREIARYRQEMLDMVKDLPESGYELSLRDIVVQPATPPRTPRVDAKALTKGKASPEKGTKATGKDQKAMERGMKPPLSWSENVEAGRFLLRMFIPFALGVGGGRRRKSTSGGANSRTKVSPRPSFEAEEGGSDGSDGEWWRNNQLTSSGGSNSSSDNSNTSNSSSSTGSSNRSLKMNGCYPFLPRDKR